MKNFDNLFAETLLQYANCSKKLGSVNKNKSHKSVTEAIFDKEIDLGMQYENYWSNIVANANNAKKPDLMAVAHGAYTLLGNSQSPVGDMGKLLALDAGTMKHVRDTGTAICAYNDLINPPKKEKEDKKEDKKPAKKSR